MSDSEPTQEELEAIAKENESCETVNYKAPAQKTLKEIHDLDADDESLRKYKETLLGGCSAVSADSNAPNVQVTQMALLCSSAPKPLVLDLKDTKSLKNQCFVLKEGVEYKIEITFRVNKEIVSGLKYLQNSYRKGVRVDKSEWMVGSYGPKADGHKFVTPLEEAPKGMLARGIYSIKSMFTDDDKNNHLSWEWNLHIKKDWE